MRDDDLCAGDARPDLAEKPKLKGKRKNAAAERGSHCQPEVMVESSKMRATPWRTY